MNIFAKTKNLWKKIAIVFTIITSISFAAPKPVAAGLGGELMEPICDFLVFVGDGVVDVVHSLVLKQDITLIRVDTKENGLLRLTKGVAVAIAIALVAVTACVVTGGIAAVVGASAGAAILSNIGAIAIISIVGGGYIGAKAYDNIWWNDEVDLPLYSITPETIFRNDDEFPLFDVNFFNPKEKKITTNHGDGSAIDYSKGQYKDSVTGMSISDLEDKSGKTISNKIKGKGQNDGLGEAWYYTEGKDVYRVRHELSTTDSAQAYSISKWTNGVNEVNNRRNK